VVTVEIENRSGADVDERGAEELARHVLSAEGIDDGDLGLLFVGPDEMRMLKREHLGIDEATDVLSFPLTDQDVAVALDGAVEGDVSEGCIGAGTGMQCFDFKGGIGSASRILDGDQGGFTVGVLVMTNHGDREDLLIDGVRVGERLTDLMPEDHHEGSCIVVVATDAPLLPHQLRRVAERAGMGLARGGSHASNTSGEQLLAFSTANRVPRDGRPFAPSAIADGPRAGTILSAIFRATVEATEEAVVNSLLAARSMTGRDGHTLYALPVDRTLELLDGAGRLVR